ncbi:hypothetical protein [Phyllobacterium zundukense]|uniref:Uncharacterized protein n=1 Tax=Phyllobacterium zundukense TaxID=1867719 RepID=A0A2N9W062_9HYPH|nr:hypothetical protein [Phyllobacterium zundukense]ATU90630.1 hypothetical protein BLM14_02375 [Phyllobacterium zundukense]PIO45130.1 hypothetical protein B5P45_08785 [Phyllobacterium zundukense]
MEFDLMTEEDYHNLPEEPELKFVIIEATCRRNMNSVISHETPASFDALIRSQYMTLVATAATELGIQGVEYPSHLSDPSEGLNRFMLDASAASTRIRLRRTPNQAGSVRLSARTRGRIELQMRKLRDVIENADMPDARRRSLIDKLNALAAEINEPRVSFAKTMAIIAFISVGITTGASFLADAPEAITTIASLIGQDKEAEDAENARLGAPPVPKALPAPAPPSTKKDGAFSRPLQDDDEIPF